MLVNWCGYRFDIDVDETRRYYEALRARPVTDPVILNQRKFMEEHVSSRILKFLNGLGITDFAGLRYKGGLYYKKSNAMRYDRAAYPVFGEVVDDEYKSSPCNFIVSVNGKMSKSYYGIGDCDYPFKLCFCICDDALDDDGAMFSDLGKPVLRLEWRNDFTPSWVLDTPFPFDSEEQKEINRCKLRHDELESELVRNIGSGARALSEREYADAMRACISAFCIKGTMEPIWDEYMERLGNDTIDRVSVLARYFLNAERLRPGELRARYSGLQAEGYTLLLGEYKVGLHATGALPSLEYVDTLLHLGVFIMDDAMSFCLIAVPDIYDGTYRLARRRDI